VPYAVVLVLAVAAVAIAISRISKTGLDREAR